MDALGQTLEGKYEILSKIKEGGMGAIYLVRHRLLNELRVIKIMRPEVADSEEQHKRFFREAQTATRLRHPNIITFYDFVLGDDGTAYMVMEFLDGVNLHELIRSQGLPPLLLARDIARQSLSALGYLHRKGVIHRDISPDNIMVMKDEGGAPEVKLIDLGIAKMANSRSELTAADSFVGKLRYCSPEQLKGGDAVGALDARSDLYSFAVVFYELLTGRIPFEGDSVQALVGAHLFHPPIPIEKSDTAGRVPQPVGQVVMKMLEPKPEDRYQTADEFSRAIDAALPMTSSAADREEETRYIAPALAKNPIREFTTPGGSAQESLDRKFGAWTTRTIAGSGNIEMQEEARPRTNVTAVPFERKTAAPLERRTVTSRPSTEATRVLATPAPAPAPPPRRKAWPYALAAAVVLGVAVAALLLHRRPPEPTKLVRNPATTVSPPPTATAGPATSSAPPGTTSTAAVSPSIGEPTETSVTPRPVTATRPPKETHPGKPPKPVERLASASPPPQTLTVPVPVPPPPPTMPRVEAPPQPYCANILPTTFQQGKIAEKPKGFSADADANVAPLPDSGRLRVVVRVTPDPPIENKPFEVVASFVNGGDLDRQVVRIEESIPRMKGGFSPISTVSLPATVQSGGSLSFYRFGGALSGKFAKTLRVIDRKGDTWESTVRIEPCD
jgi:serine/threonine-protein kinase